MIVHCIVVTVSLHVTEIQLDALRLDIKFNKVRVHVEGEALC